MTPDNTRFLTMEVITKIDQLADDIKYLADFAKEYKAKKGRLPFETLASNPNFVMLAKFVIYEVI